MIDKCAADTVPSPRRFGLSREIRLGELLVILTMVIGFSEWRASDARDKAVMNARIDAAMDSSVRVAASQERLADTMKIIQEQVTNTRLAVAQYHGTGAIR